MNYIKTKDKIIKAKTNKWHELVDKNGKYIAEFEIIAQADIIEELCDEFVIEKKGYTPFVSQTLFYNGKEHKEDLKALAEYYSGYDNIYGAIWTPKDLIYVAKMNEKGELELI